MSASTQQGASEPLRAQPSLDDSFSQGLGLGIVVQNDGTKVTKADLRSGRVKDRPVSEILAGSNPFQRTEHTSASPPRASEMPSSATVDRLVINDVLEQYKPGENSILETSFPPPVSTAPMPSFLGPALGLGSLRMHDEPSLDAFLVHEPPASAAEHEPHAPPSGPEAASTAPPPRTPPSPDRVPKIVLKNHAIASPARQSSPKRPMPPEIGDLANPTTLPSPERLRSASPDRLHEAPVGQVADDMLDVDALLAEGGPPPPPADDDSGSVNVDDLLQENPLESGAAGMARSATMRQIHASEREAPAPALAPEVDLPTLPSWSPIVWDELLPDLEPRRQPRAVELPERTVRPRISRDAIRARVEQKKSHVLNDIPWERRQASSAAARPPPRGPMVRQSFDEASASSSRAGPPPLHSPLARVETALQGHASHTASHSESAAPWPKELERERKWFGGDPIPSPNPTAPLAPPTEERHDDSENDEFASPLSRVSALPSDDADTLSPGNDSGPSTAFRHLMERELTRIVRESDKRYKVRERGVFVGTRPERGFPTAHAPWKRVHQPNEVVALSQTARAATPRLDTYGATTHGRLFLSLDAFIPAAISVSPGATFYCVLDNKIHRVKTASVPLNPPARGETVIDQEFELVESPHFSLSITLLLDEDDGEEDNDGEAAEMGALPAEARTGVGRFLSRHLGTRAARDTARRSKVPVPTRPGVLGTAQLVLGDILPECYARCATLELPVRVDAEHRTLRRHPTLRTHGSLRVRVFYLPPLPESVQQELPGNMEEALQGMSAVAWRDTATSYEGVLTQLGGDCASWRRRPMRIVGLNLVCYNEVTKRPVTRIDLVQAVSIDERPPAIEGRDADEVCQVPRSFCLTFRDGERIYLYADSDAEKVAWMRTLHNILAHKLTPPPAWAMAAAHALHTRFATHTPTPFSEADLAVPSSGPLPSAPPSGPASQGPPPPPEVPPPPTLSSRVTPAVPTGQGARAPPREPPRPAKPAPPPTQTPPPPPQPAPRPSTQEARPVDAAPEADKPPIHGARRAAQRVRHMASRWLVRGARSP
ncbi:Bud site selection protein bud4 [Malassezia nana]|uniref:Bud site selection protein bud4 n=1 Tax=Malassezia nana TaxID=180528 RepID=A0AAF0EPM3_9BASI|nr:Bud site selection protein bud4 [Malassezia nana]